MIKSTELTKKYGDTTVLNIKSLEIPKGQTFGLVGNNGAGKTTFFNLLLDLIQPTTGFIINSEIQVDKSEEWKPFTAAFIDEILLLHWRSSRNEQTRYRFIFTTI
jgi:ABC-2 type transport system ATP-binding protein